MLVTSVLTTLVIVFAVVPAIALLAGAIAARRASHQRVRSLVVQYLPERGATVLHDALLADRRAAAIPAVIISLAVSRRIRILAEPSKSSPVAVEVEPGATFSAAELAVLEALFGPDHTPSRVRRFSSDRRALGRRVRHVLDITDDILVDDGFLARRPTAWPVRLVGTLGVLGIIACVVFAIISWGSWLAFGLSLASLALVVAALIVNPKPWRRFTEAAKPHREHLDGLRQYMTLAEADRLKMLQSPSGAERIAPSTASTTSTGSTAGDAALERLVLTERLLPYALIFGLSAEWMAELRVRHDELASLDLDIPLAALDIAGDLIVLTAAVSNLADLAGALGDLVDVGGGVIEVVGDALGGIGDLLP
ncbi:DUF2207 domain-containing protein [Agromyces atrinae]|uniref:DUF2207 domain-containing protein n=1 Tax=Agromyces atrinae TaxID=592376 RepID=A0A4V1R219_9MICO|nr:DUF2207 domain-containing protein [Agromyces atrinae]NYD68333.1 hypothetical protein [Agromyces atrinae]RXZ85616.1 DUF2207 domain-containing protein [Agromyces atrinae]